MVQLASLLILYTGANTSFNGFPFLASFVAEDAFLPRWLTTRGHRLTFSNGIIVLAAVSIALLIVTRAQVNSLVAIYAIGVFTGFTMAGAGMTKHHLTHREAGWRHKIFINGFAAVLSGNTAASSLCASARRWSRNNPLRTARRSAVGFRSRFS